jgi:hypothetical protein
MINQPHTLILRLLLEIAILISLFYKQVRAGKQSGFVKMENEIGRGRMGFQFREDHLRYEVNDPP